MSAVHGPGAVRRLAVLGSPIAHSLSPVLQQTAYRLLGLPFDYGRSEVATDELDDFLASLDESWLGLSLTMPLKREVVRRLDSSSPLVDLLGVANTVVLSWNDGRAHLAGHNTDVDGMTRAITAQHEARRTHAAILGGGATASSALAAVQELGADRVSLFLRDVSRADQLESLAESIGLQLDVVPLDSLASVGPWDFVVSTLPGGAADDLPVLPSGPEAVLLDVAYEPWPTALATGWASHGGTIVSGLDMLVEQAIGQIRLFTGQAQEAALPDEDRIRRAMRSAVGLAPVTQGAVAS